MSTGPKSMIYLWAAPIKRVKTTAIWPVWPGLLAGLPVDVPGVTLNRLCGSGLDAIVQASRMIKSGEGSLAIAGGTESMSRAPFVLAKATSAFSRSAESYDTTIGWRFVNKAMASQYGVDSMPETAENVASEFSISREDQDKFAHNSQVKAKAAQGRRTPRRRDNSCGY